MDTIEKIKHYREYWKTRNRIAYVNSLSRNVEFSLNIPPCHKIPRIGENVFVEMRGKGFTMGTGYKITKILEFQRIPSIVNNEYSFVSVTYVGSLED